MFAGAKGLSTDARVHFLGHPFQVTYSENILGRVFNGSGGPMDGKPELTEMDALIEQLEENALVDQIRRHRPIRAWGDA